MNFNPETAIIYRKMQAEFAGRKSASHIFAEIKQHPDLLEQTIDGIDDGVRSLNTFLQLPNNIALSQSAILSQSVAVYQQSPMRRFRTIRDMAVSQNRKDAEACGRAFLEGTNYIRHGEVHQAGSFGYFKDGSGLDLMIDTLGMAIFGYRLSYDPEVRRNTSDLGGEIYKAIAEMIVVHHSDSRLYGSIKHMIDTRIQFSQQLCAIVQGNIDPLFHPGQILRKTPNFEVRADNIAIDGVDTRGVLIVPKSPKGNTILLDATANPAATRLILPSDQREGLPQLQFAAAGEFTPFNLRRALGGFNPSVESGQLMLPSVEVMEELISRGQLQYPR